MNYEIIYYYIKIIVLFQYVDDHENDMNYEIVLLFLHLN